MARAANSCTRGNEPMHAVRWLASPRQGECFLRGRKALLNDFWYFSSQKSTIKEKHLYVSIRRQQALPCLGDADRVCFANRSIPALQDKKPSASIAKIKKYTFHPVSAGTGSTPAMHFQRACRTMRARICSAFSCDMFARVVCLRLRRAQNCQLVFYPLSRSLDTHGSRD